MQLNQGDLAPDFTLLDQDKQAHSLSDYRGQKVILYFYPKDDTPGCTAEACSFRDNFSEFKKHGIVILGVSADNAKSHAKFQEKYSLPFRLLSDEDHHVIEEYGAWGPKKFMGKEFFGVLRTTYVIDEEGKVLKVFEKVKPQEHAREILDLFA